MTVRTYTINEAAEATGLSQKAIRNRVDREQLRASLRDGVRRIPASELERAGLIGPGGEAAKGQQPQGGSLGGNALGELLDRLERQAGELAELRVIEREADSLRADRGRLEALAHEQRARVLELEARLAEAQAPRRWWHRRASAEASTPATP
ncbi:MAG: hypothetical protein DLM63_00465 [Solirubrobacterales bacterium]|nr:MAG: hypothetical protein DLM63_00465 [Solirubrobacterales bacterium]